MAPLLLFIYIVAPYFQKNVCLLLSSKKANSAQSIEHFIKKSFCLFVFKLHPCYWASVRIFWEL